MLEPGNYVKWKRRHVRAQISRILERSNGHLVVEANGSAYEIDPATDVIYWRLACARCGKPTNRMEDQYCSYRCYYGAFHDDVDQWVLDAIVSYKRQNDGLSPTSRYLSNMTGFDTNTILRALKRLEDAGRIRRIGPATQRQIIVVGGKWTYEGDHHASN